jgi:membrane-associated PAP2 superfamily phosphatase
VGGYFAFNASCQRLARQWLAAALAAGMVLGLAQQWRGAHFMSHTLWSAAVCWAVACAVRALWPRNGAPEGIR